MHSVICPNDSRIINIIVNLREAERITTWINQQPGPTECSPVRRLLEELHKIREADSDDPDRELQEGRDMPERPTTMSFDVSTFNDR